jgi:hypothetical protein
MKNFFPKEKSMAISDLFKEVIKLESKVTGRVYDPPILNTEIQEDLNRAIGSIINKTHKVSGVTYEFPSCRISVKDIDKKELLRVLKFYEEYL